MLRLIRIFLLNLIFVLPAVAQETQVNSASPLQKTVEKHAPDIIKGSVKTAPPIIEEITEIGDATAMRFLSLWQEKSLWYRKATIGFLPSRSKVTPPTT